MAKQNLTSDGVENKTAEVYAMTTINRMAEASAIESGFKTWVSDNFYLDTPQSDYLAGMNSTVATNYGRACAIAFRHMCEIAAIWPTPPSPPPSKWVVLQNDLVIGTNASDAEEVTGSLTFEIEYRS